MIGFIEISVVVILACFVLASMGFGVIKAWDVVVNTRRKHRLQAEEDERAHRRLMAEDYTESLRALENLGGTMNYRDYIKEEQRIKVLK